uniref:Uncharacterized protein n=1 Tax=Cyanothece sp. (strain PCC 7425 / ATCC 29141) TaxID=395961 RepID=B8HYV8_CYAP4
METRNWVLIGNRRRSSGPYLLGKSIEWKLDVVITGLEETREVPTC